jgi:hypothetical protein
VCLGVCLCWNENFIHPKEKLYEHTCIYVCDYVCLLLYIYLSKKKKKFVTIYIYLYVCIQVRSDGKEIRSSMFMCANGKINNVSNAIINKDEPFDNGSLAK